MLAQVLVSSVTAGAVYALIALGFVLIHKGTGVVHFGYGDQVMFGAYLVLIGQIVFGLPFWPAVLAALVLSGLLGAVIYWRFHVAAAQRLAAGAHHCKPGAGYGAA